MPADATPARRPPSRAARIALIFAVLLLAMLLALRWMLQPQRATAFLLARLGDSLGLEITTSGTAQYRLRGTPMLVLRDVVAREPGAAGAMLRADRILVSLPWSTLRARGARLDATRLELDAPVLDLPALQHWLATRPAAKEKRLPTLSQGLRIRDGSIVNDSSGSIGRRAGNSWRIEGIDVELPLLAAMQPMHARLHGRYLDPPLRVGVDLAVTLMRPSALLRGRATGFGAAGRILAADAVGSWQLPATVSLSGPLEFGADELRVTPARLGVAATYAAGDTRLPFAFGAHGPLLFDEATWTLAPVGLVLHGRGDPISDPVPTLQARGRLALGHRLQLRLHGALAAWPRGWPALPAPLGQSRVPLPFALDYAGGNDLSDVASLQLQRDATRVQARFRLRTISDWIGADDDNASPLPPLDGTVTTPRIEIDGVRLDGVEVTMDDSTIDDSTDTGSTSEGTDGAR